MLTAIYVYEPSTLQISSTHPKDKAVIRRYPEVRPDLRSALGTQRLEPGVYAILSHYELQIEWLSGRGKTASSSAGKDDWPDPPAVAASTAREDLTKYFDEIVKGGDLGDLEPAEPGEPQR